MNPHSQSACERPALFEPITSTVMLSAALTNGSLFNVYVCSHHQDHLARVLGGERRVREKRWTSCEGEDNADAPLFPGTNEVCALAQSLLQYLHCRGLLWYCRP